MDNDTPILKLEIPVEERVRVLIIDSLLVEEPRTVSPQANILTDFGATSLDLVELTMDIELVFGIEISDEEAECMVLVQHITGRDIKDKRSALGEIVAVLNRAKLIGMVCAGAQSGFTRERPSTPGGMCRKASRHRGFL